MNLLFWVPTLVYAILIFSLSHQSTPPGADYGPDYLLHFIEFGIFALTVIFGLTRGFQRKLTPRLGLIAWGASTLYGGLDEFHQYFIPDRFSSVQDLLADSLGAATVVGLFLLVNRYRRFRER